MILSLILGAATAAALPASWGSGITVEKTVPDSAGESVLQPFVSFSIEFAWFPVYAGTNCFLIELFF